MGPEHFYVYKEFFIKRRMLFEMCPCRNAATLLWYQKDSGPVTKNYIKSRFIRRVVSFGITWPKLAKLTFLSQAVRGITRSSRIRV